MYNILLARLRWLKGMWMMMMSRLSGNAASRLAARHTISLARMQVMFENTRLEALKSLKRFGRGA